MRKELFVAVAALVAVEATSPAQVKRAELRPSDNYWDRGTRNAAVHISRISPNRKLASVGDTIFMLDRRNRIVWTWTTGGAPLTDVPVVDSKGIIYIIALDLIRVALDGATGKVKWWGSANGRAAYTQIELYGRDMYLVVTYMGGYRESLSDRTITDGVSLCRMDSVLWTGEIPADARILVRGHHAYWVVKHKGRMLSREIPIPRTIRRPIGKWATDLLLPIR